MGKIINTKILMIEDNLEFQNITSLAFEKLDLASTLYTVSSFTEAKKKINKIDFELIITEETISNQTWDELLKLKRLSIPEAPSIIVIKSDMIINNKYERALETLERSQELFDCLPKMIPYFIKQRKLIFESVIIKDELAMHKAQFKAISEFAAEAIITVDSIGKIVFWNRGAEKMFGYTDNEIEGSFAYRLIPLRFQKVVKKEIKKFKNGDITVPVDTFIESEAIDNNGREFNVEFSISSWLEQGARYYMAIIRDVSKRKRTYEELLRVQKSESLGTIASGIAHDFNNILTGIVTDLFAAKMNLKIQSEEYAIISNAEKSVFRATSLARQFMDFTSSTDDIFTESLDITPIIEEAVGFTLSGSNVSYRLNVAENILAVEVDRGLINQVVSNLILNSAQAMPYGGTIDVVVENIEIAEGDNKSEESFLNLKSGNYLKVSVADTGEGIEKENIDKIFDPYFTTKKNGSGFGLATAFFIINRYGGTITVDSTPQYGSTFVFYLPALKNTLIEKNYEGEIYTTMLRPNGTILVMDDDLSVQKALQIVLKHIGYPVKLTATGEEAIEQYRKHADNGEKFSAVIMDLTIPGHMGGKEAVGKILEIDAEAKVIVSTGYSSDPVMLEFEKYGFCATINKPFTIDAVKRVLAKITNSN